MNKEIEVKIASGLHTRPAGRLAVLAQECDIECFISYNNQRVNVVSILDLITLMIPCGAKIELEIYGNNAAIFLQKATDLLDDVV